MASSKMHLPLGSPGLLVRFVLRPAALLLVLTQAVAWAQSPASPAEALDPPGRVARLNLVEGAVSYAPGAVSADGDNNSWTQAQLNRPLTSGDRLWTDQRSRSELHAGSTTLRMNAQTSLDFIALDDNVTQLRLAQGSVNLRVRSLLEGQRLEVDTPNLAFVVSKPGDYRLDVDPAGNTTRVVSQSGAGVIYGDSGTPLALGNQQQASFTGTNLAPGGSTSPSLDAFDNWALSRDRAEDQSVSARYVSRETVGYQQLDNYGDWTQDPSYGAVWLPRAVPANWAPYRAGHWDFIRPWGWTWVDDAPWGFAPFHYGRWAQIGPRWAWVPGRIAPRPVYAPALVAFVGGNGDGLSWNLSIGGGARPALGWFPLAPGEAFRPAYRSSPRYVTQVNNNIVINNVINQTQVSPVYRYQRSPAAVTAVSRADFAQGRQVRVANVALSAADLSRAQVVDGNRAVPQRPEGRPEQPRQVAALPPSAISARPVVTPADSRRDARADQRREEPRNDRREERRDERPANAARLPAAPVAAVSPAASPAYAAPAQAAAPLRVAPPAVVQDRSAIDAERRSRNERERAQQERISQAPGNESIGQRALREQAERNGAAPAQRPAMQQHQPVDHSIEQAQRAQQQMQRDQQRQQRDLTRQADEQRRQSEESIGQRALREQAAKQQQEAGQRNETRTQQEQQQKERAGQRDLPRPPGAQRRDPQEK